MAPESPDTVHQFIEAWGAMGALWGINRSVARVHALLMATDTALSLDEIAERLQISKGNASMALRDLRGLGVVRQVDVPGDRRDFYVTEPDVWTMFFRILKERKRREFDPALEAVRGLLARPPSSGVVAGRLRQMSELLATAERVADRLLADPESSRAALTFVAGLPLGRKRKMS
jgi:DNA-binding transcriptional regulator GbsR (MarR family)